MSIEQLYSIFQECPIVTTDSRSVPEGSIFFALKGARFNGNKYAKDALQKGASYAVIDEAAYADAQNQQLILVDDVLQTLQKLANYHRMQLNIPVIGITGSNGKTTTKELLNAVLSTQFKTSFTAGNFNNHIGVPLTLLRIPKDTEIAIVEMGANHQGEIALLSTIAAPTHGIINNIGKAHLEGFGGVEGIKKGKSELYAYLAANNGVAFVNTDLPFLKELAQQRGVKNVTAYQNHQALDTAIDLKTTDPFVQFEMQHTDNEDIIKVESHLIGQYNFYNILTAIAIGRFFEVALEQIKVAIESYIPQNNRSQIIQRDTNTIILDAYNANPTSIQHAIEHFATVNAARKIVILGDMLELGKESYAEHLQIARLAQNSFFYRLIFVGKEFSKVKNTVSCLHFDDVILLKAWFAQQNFQNTHILIKGSRGIKLEQILEDYSTRWF